LVVTIVFKIKTLHCSNATRLNLEYKT
jgi:hypothetical protein